MKKIVIALAALSLLCAPAHAQGFLNKLKERAEQAIGNVAGGIIPESMKQSAEAPQTAQVGETDGIGAVSGKQALPAKRSSRFGWDSPVTPSSASDPARLFSEFPAVPSAAALANPTEEAQIAYYNAIKAVTLRAEELNLSNTCKDSETLDFRNKKDQMLKENFGLTDAEIRALENPNTPEAEKTRISDKIAKALLGDLDPNAISGQLEGKNEEEMARNAMSTSAQAVFAVYDRNASDIRKYCGVSAEDFKNATRAQMNASNPDKECPEMVALRAKVKAFQDAQPAAFQKEAKAFEQRMQKETMNASMSSIGLSGMGNLMGSVADIQNKMVPIVEYNRKATQYVQQMTSLVQLPATSAVAGFSAADKEKVLSIKDRIYKTPDASVYNPLYLEALQLIASYRERASKVWAAEVQKNFNTLKGNLSSLVSLNRKAVSDEIIPECAALRAPYNLIIQAGDILSDAYREFPADYPVMYLEEVIKSVAIEGAGFPGPANANDSGSDADGSIDIWWPEFSVFSNADYESIASGRHIYASGSGANIYRYNGGGWTALSEEELKSLNAKKKDASAPKSTSWKSKDGKRTVFYNAEGGFLQLPEGDQAYPMVLKWSDDAIQWLYTKIAKSANGKNEYQIIQCTYKL